MAHNVTSAAYATVTTAPISVSKVLLCDTSGKFVYLATGAAGHEANIMAWGLATGINGCMVVPSFITAGTRISVKAVNDNSIATGLLTISFLNN